MFKIFFLVGACGIISFAGESIKMHTSAKAPENKYQATPESINRGAKVYTENACNVCHGNNGRGDGPGSKGLQFPPRNFVSSNFLYGDRPLDLFKTISDGVPKRGMPSYAQLKPEMKWDLVFYILSLKKTP